MEMGINQLYMYRSGRYYKYCTGEFSNEAEADALNGDTTPATEAKEADQEVVIGDSEMQDAEEIAVSDDIEEIGEDPMLRETGRIVSDLIDLLNGDRPRMTPNQPMTAKAAPKKPIPAG